MTKTFRSWDVDQSWLLPRSVHEFVPEGHLAHFVRDTVREGLDLSTILACYGEERGFPPYHPGMMVALLLYGYSRGIYSSRQLARACEERGDMMAVTGLNQPDFRTISDFRKRHLAALSDLFVQVLRLCRAAGLVQFGHVDQVKKGLYDLIRNLREVQSGRWVKEPEQKNIRCSSSGGSP